MTRGTIGTVFWGVWLVCVAVSAAQLPPEVMVDQYLLRADRLLEAEDPKGALDLMNKIVALQKEHGLTFPEEFHFKYAKVALSAGSIQAAKESLNKYLTVATRGDGFYREALELSLEIGELDVERISCAGQPKGSECWMEMVNQPKSYVWNSSYHPVLTVTWTGGYFGNLAHGQGTLKWGMDIDQVPPDKSPSQAAEPKCAGQPQGTSCWIKVSGHPECFVWNGYLVTGEVVTWTGESSGGQLQGQGTLKWARSYGSEFSETGSFHDGKKHGQWVRRFSSQKDQPKQVLYWYGEIVGSTAEDELVMEGRLVKGKKHGRWVMRDADGDVSEGPYVEGKRHGQWVMRDADGDVREGPYVEGKRHGQWVMRDADGDVREGLYVEGKRHGRWVMRDADGNVSGGSYVEGKRHGQWVVRDADGDVREGLYVEGKRHGQWVMRDADGDVREGLYVEGKRHGEWVFRWADGRVWEGSYVKGEMHGESVFRRKDGSVASEGPYVKGERHGEWVFRNEDGTVTEGSYVDGKQHGHWVQTNEPYKFYDTNSFSDRTITLFVSEKGPYVEGNRHGHWVSHWAEGSLRYKGNFVEGKRHGHWVQRMPGNNDLPKDYLSSTSRFGTDDHIECVRCVAEGPYVEGKRHGHWVSHWADGSLRFKGNFVEDKRHGRWVESDSLYHGRNSRHLIEGPYLEGKKHGDWVIYRRSDKKKRVRGGGAYVDGEKSGRWIEVNSEGKKRERSY